MGSPKFSKKKYNTPKHPWKEGRIESERELIKKYGLKNHKEVWKSKLISADIDNKQGNYLQDQALRILKLKRKVTNYYYI